MSNTVLSSGQDGLDRVNSLTKKMREHQQAISQLSAERKEVVMALRANFSSGADKVTFKKIAEAMGTTDQSVYKILFPQKKSKASTEG